MEQRLYKYEDIRNFYFENEKGEQIDCQELEGYLFFYNVTGLGYEENIEYNRIGNTFVQSNKEVKQNQIGGEIEFYERTCEIYEKFINFILNSEDLKIIYVPKGSNKRYYRNVDFASIQKTEEDDDNILTTPILLNCTSLWYEKNVTIYSINRNSNEMRWDFKWDSKFNDYNTRRLEFINKGHVEASILLEIDGQVINPKLELYIEGELYQTVTMDIEIQEYEKLLYGTKENDFYVNKQNTDGTLVSVFSCLKFENDNVIRFPKNRSCELRIKADNEITKAKVTILVFYKTV